MKKISIQDNLTQIYIIEKRVEDAHNHSSMSTHVEIIIPGMTDFVVHNSTCKTKKKYG